MKIYNNKHEILIENNIKPNLKKIYKMKVQGMKDRHIAQALGMTEHEFIKIKEEYPLLKDTYDSAMEILCARLTNIVVDRALGTDGRADKDGNLLPPDEKLAFKLLEKFDNRFTSKQEIKQTFSIEQIIKTIGKEKEVEEIENKDKEEEVIIENENDEEVI